VTRFEYALWGAKAVAVRGAALPHARLDACKVKEIRANQSGLTAKQLAEKFNVHHRTIEKVRSNETWSHIK
jgi:hypothetical protein